MRSTTSSQSNVIGGGSDEEGWAIVWGETLEDSLLADEDLVDTGLSAPGGVVEGNIVVAPPLGRGRVCLGRGTGFSAGAWILAGCAGGRVDDTGGNTFAG